jgi:hypothetical protein
MRVCFRFAMDNRDSPVTLPSIPLPPLFVLCAFTFTYIFFLFFSPIANTSPAQTTHQCIPSTLLVMKQHQKNTSQTKYMLINPSPIPKRKKKTRSCLSNNHLCINPSFFFLSFSPPYTPKSHPVSSCCSKLNQNTYTRKKSCLRKIFCSLIPLFFTRTGFIREEQRYPCTSSPSHPIQAWGK